MMKLVFPVNSDEQAIDCKKKIVEVLSTIPESHIDFRITTMPPIPSRPSM